MKTCNPRFGQPLQVREIQVLEGIAKGLSNAEIAKTLFLSEDTIKSHNRRLFIKLGVGDRTLAVVRAIQLGLLLCPCRQSLAARESRPVAS